MIRSSFIFSLTLMAITTLFSQAQKRLLMIDDGCNFANSSNAQMIEVEDPSKEMSAKVQEILTATGSKISIQLLASKQVTNARASRNMGSNYITYNPIFVQNFSTTSLTKWAAYFLLAHEVGHHVLKHNFQEKNTTIRYKYEFAADSFATVALVKMHAEPKEITAGIQTFDKDAGSHTHPDPSAREEKINEVYEATKIPPPPPPPPPDTERPQPTKFVITLDPECFLNKWNCIQPNMINAIGDEEKITINFDIPSVYANRKFKICVKTKNYVIPGSKFERSIKGVGENISYKENMTIVWNYRMDMYSTPEVSGGELISVYVFDMSSLPPTSFLMPKLGTGAVVAIGLGGIITGAVKMANGKSYYDNVYKETFKEEDRVVANKKYVAGQYFIGAGAVLSTVGVCALIRSFKNERDAKKATCYEPRPKISMEPILADAGFGLGLRLGFK